MMAEKILPLIRKEIPDVRFTVVGEKPSAEIMSLDGKNGITVTGWVPDVRPYIDGSSVYVLPVEIASGIRVKLFEALAMGIPVVAMKTACEGHDVRSGEDILIAETPEDFARKTVSLLQDPALWSRISSEGRKRVVERYRWDVSGKTLEEALSALA
jgi:glycosyltransferase involved in cell wall biosynthesis